MIVLRFHLAFMVATSALPLLAVTYGYVARITINKMIPSSPPDSSTGVVPLSSSGSYYQLYYYNGSVKTDSAVLSDLGYTINRDIDGTAISTPNYQYRNFHVVGGIRQYVVNSSSPTNSFGVLDSPHSLGPVYGSSSGLPFTVNDANYVTGVNSSFDVSSLQPLQGDLQFDGSSVDQYMYYSSSGMPSLSSAPAVWGDGQNVWAYEDGSWNLTSAALNPGGGDLDLSPVVEAVNTQGGLTREQLVALLGSSGQPWVYDCKLSLAQLYSLASAQGLVTRPQIDLSSVQSSLDVIASHAPPDVSGLNKQVTQVQIDSKLGTANSQLYNIYTKQSSINTHISAMDTDLSSIKTVLTGWDSSSAPSFGSPNLGSDTPDDAIPFDVSGFNSSVSQSLGELVSWGSSGAPVLFPDVFSDLLSHMIGTIPSVGSDPVMFQFEVDLPYLGHVQKTWSFSDWPFIGTFRTFLLWVLYVFFGLAMFKLLHATLI